MTTASDRFEPALAKLLDRLQKEINRARPDSPAKGTERAGGWARIGSALDQFFRVSLTILAAENGRSSADVLANVPGQPLLARATAGQISRCLRSLRLPAKPHHALAAVYRDVTGPRRSSRIIRLLDLRNVVIHDAEEVVPSDAIEAMTAVERLLRT
jgi:hypothetical protein